MNATGKLMHMDVCIDKEDVVELMVVGIEKRQHGGNVREYGMTLTVQTPRFLVKDYKLGDQFEIHLSQLDRQYQLDPTLDPEFQKADPYQVGGEKMHNVIVMQSMQGEGDSKRVQRQAFKEAFYMALKIRMQDPEFREQMLRDIEVAGKRR